MPTRPVEEVFEESARDDPKFRVELIAEAHELLADGDIAIAKSILRKYVLPVIGYEVFAETLNEKSDSIKQMLSDESNPSMQRIAALIAALCKHEGIELEVRATPCKDAAPAKSA